MKIQSALQEPEEMLFDKSMIELLKTVAMQSIIAG
jgi:hypothetical protein